MIVQGFPGGSVGKASAYNAGDPGLSKSVETSLWSDCSAVYLEHTAAA